MGSVSIEVYLRWAMAAGGLHAGVIILLSYAFGEGESLVITCDSISTIFLP
jgi:hypothetical protein